MAGKLKICRMKAYKKQAENKKRQGLISVIIPVYNCAQFLSACIDSVLKQSYPHFEVICVNDASTDNVEALLTYYQKKDERIKVIHLSKNSGLSVVRNTGIAASKGQYISFLDGDDFLEQGTFKECVKLIEERKVDCVLFNMRMFFPDGTGFPCFNGSLFPQSGYSHLSLTEERCFNFTNAPPALFRASSISCRFKEGVLYEDWIFMMNYLSLGRRVFWVNKTFYQYRRGFASTITSNISNKSLDLFGAYYDALKLLQERGLDKKAGYINDFKILNEGAGFVEARILPSGYSDAAEQFLCELRKIVAGMGEAYFVFLCSHVVPIRQRILKEIRYTDKNIPIKVLFQSLYQCCHNKFGLGFIYRLMPQKIKGLFHKFRFRGLAKKILRTVSPAYKVSADVRDIIVHHLGW